jgi:hypothetical protein
MRLRFVVCDGVAMGKASKKKSNEWLYFTRYSAFKVRDYVSGKDVRGAKCAGEKTELQINFL